MRRKSRKNVGLIGLGIIGSRAAACLRGRGFQVFVWNRTPKPVPNFLGSPAEVADVCFNIQIFVSDAEALMEVLEAMRGKLTAEHVVICNATVGPEATAQAAELVQASGARFLDAPFTGSKLAAERNQLVYYVGGEEETYLRVKPILEATSKAIVRVGGIGDAATLKVVTNLISAASVQVLSEALAIVTSAGLPPETLSAALEHNAARSGVIDLKLPNMLASEYEPHFSLKHMLKDVRLGVQIAAKLGVQTPVTAATAARMSAAAEEGWAEDDFSVVHRMNAVASKPQPPSPVGSPPALRDKPVESVVLAETSGLKSSEEKPSVVKIDEEPSEAKRPSAHLFARVFGEEDDQRRVAESRDKGQVAPTGAGEKSSPGA